MMVNSNLYDQTEENRGTPSTMGLIREFSTAPLWYKDSYVSNTFALMVLIGENVDGLLNLKNKQTTSQSSH